MGKFLLGFALGLGVGAAIAVLLTPEPGDVRRARLRAQTDRFAAGDETPLGAVQGKLEEQRNRLEEAIEAGRRASAARQAELWAQLHLAPPDEDASAPPPIVETPKLPS